MGSSGGKVHRIVEGTGGVFHLRDESRPGRQSKPIHETIREFDRDELIGVEQCNVGVGVYFTIAPDMFFCAHIHATTGERGPRAPHPSQAEDIARVTVGKLNDLRREQGWHPDNAIETSLITVCPWGELGGKAVARGVCDFLNTQGHWSEILNTQAHGFVVEPHHTKDRKLMMVDPEPRMAEGIEDIKKASRPLPGFKMSTLKLPKNEWRWVQCSLVPDSRRRN